MRRVERLLSQMMLMLWILPQMKRSAMRVPMRLYPPLAAQAEEERCHIRPAENTQGRRQRSCETSMLTIRAADCDTAVFSLRILHAFMMPEHAHACSR